MTAADIHSVTFNTARKEGQGSTYLVSLDILQQAPFLSEQLGVLLNNIHV